MIIQVQNYAIHHCPTAHLILRPIPMQNIWPCHYRQSTRLTILCERCFWQSIILFNPIVVYTWRCLVHCSISFCAAVCLLMLPGLLAWPTEDKNVWQRWFEGGEPRTSLAINTKLTSLPAPLPCHICSNLTLKANPQSWKLLWNQRKYSSATCDTQQT